MSSALKGIGGVHEWLLKVYIGLIIFAALIGLVTAIVIPNYQAYQRRAAESSAQKQQAETKKEAGEWLSKGMSLQMAHKFSAAIDAYNKAITINPDNPEYYTLRGSAYDDSGNMQDALMDFNRALELNPQHMEAYFFRGLVYAKLGDEQRKINDWVSAARLGHDKAQEILRGQGVAW